MIQAQTKLGNILNLQIGSREDMFRTHQAQAQLQRFVDILQRGHVRHILPRVALVAHTRPFRVEHYDLRLQGFQQRVTLLVLTLAKWKTSGATNFVAAKLVKLFLEQP